jgi:hypothetical protein
LRTAFRFARGLILIAAINLLTPLALAADPKPAAAVKTRAVEAGVFVDDKIKADPELAAEGLRIFGGARPKGDGDEQP